MLILNSEQLEISQVIAVNCCEDIPDQYRNSPFELLLEYHNLQKPYGTYVQAKLLVGMCIDNRNCLRLPDNFAYIIRSGGANMRYSEFKISYAISIGEVKHIALIAHSQCGMVNLISRKEQFICGLVERAGWDRERAEKHFLQYAPLFEIGNEIDFTLKESKRLKRRYPNIQIAPMLYKVEDNKLYMINEN
jgi:carbonic anhydrase